MHQIAVFACAVAAAFATVASVLPEMLHAAPVAAQPVFDATGFQPAGGPPGMADLFHDEKAWARHEELPAQF